MFSVKNLEFALLLLANIGTILSLLPYAALGFSVEKVVDRAGTLHNVDTKSTVHGAKLVDLALSLTLLCDINQCSI